MLRLHGHRSCAVPHAPFISRTLTACAVAAAAQTTTEFRLSDRPAVFDRAALEARPAVTQTVSYLSGSGLQAHPFVGTSPWGLLNSAGIQPSPAIGNDANSRIVVDQGSDGHRSVYLLGKLNPNFGNLPANAAYSTVVGGATLPLGSGGFARTTAPGDMRGGRYVSNLTDLQLQRATSTVASTGGGMSISFSVNGDVLRRACSI